MLSEEERLREALLEMEERLVAEKQRREELEALLEGLTCLTSTNRDVLYDALLPVLRRALRYDDAILLVEQVEAQGVRWVARAATRPELLSARFPMGPRFQRALRGQPLALFDARSLEEWAEQPAPVLDRVGSALYVPLVTRRERAMLVGVHSDRSFFSQRHVKLARRFAVMAVEVLDGIDARELLQERRSAEERARLLEEKLATIRAQQAELLRLSAPVIRIWDRILVIPLVGSFDREHAARATERLLDAIVKERARRVILDVTGLEEADAEAGENIERMIHAASLLGSRCVVTGVRPRMAQVLTSRRVDLGVLRPFANLREGLKAAFRDLGLAIRRARGARPRTPLA
jgi:rsbT co-antagonist protein RsbR